MGRRPRPRAAVTSTSARLPSTGRPLSGALAIFATAAMLAVACGGSEDAEPTDVDLSALSEFLSSASTSAPADASEPTVRDDGTAGHSDPAGGSAVAGEGAVPGEDAVPDPNDETEATTGAADGRSTDVANDAPSDVGEPVAVPDGPKAPLTGELTTDSALAQRRALAVKVDNGDRRGRPQAGLAAADLVYEMLIEAGKTRFLAVFHSEIPGRVGPVRSVRSGDFDLLADLSTPYLVSSGANTTVLAEMRQAVRAGTLVDIGGLRNFVPYTRDPARRSPFNLYFHYENLLDGDADALPPGPLAAPVAPLFDYGSTNPEGLADATGVTVTFHRSSGNVISHIWDAAVGGWVRIQGGALMTTETDFGLTEVAPVNVAVVWMPHRVSAAEAESPQALSYGTGDALVLTAGTVHNAVWERTEDRAGFRFSDAAGNPLSLSPGSTWLLLANTSRRYPVAEAAIVTASDGARLLADARAVANPAANVADVS